MKVYIVFDCESWEPEILHKVFMNEDKAKLYCESSAYKIIATNKYRTLSSNKLKNRSVFIPEWEDNKFNYTTIKWFEVVEEEVIE